jgi:hypothetical protein
VDNYELHMKTHTCHDDCQNPICVAVRKAVEAEREACAKVCEHFLSSKENDDAWIITRDLALQAAADVIRARGNNGL